MNDRERFSETVRFGHPDRLPLWECAFWGETLERWVEEGLPLEVAHPDGPGSGATQESLRSYFGFDQSFGIYFRHTVDVDLGLCPPFAWEVLAEENGVRVIRGSDGVISRYAEETHGTQFIRFPVESRADFEAIKKRFDPDSPARFAVGWKEKVLRLQAMGAPVCINAGGYYGFARSLMGMENLSYAFYDQPELVEEIFEFRSEYVSRILEKALQEIKPDFAEFWEDMAYKNGPLISPALYRKMALKHYRRITDLLAKYGVKTVLIDSDGNVDELIPIWLDGGINCLWPLEIAAGTDIIALRKKYGQSLALIGGIDKRALAGSKEDIRAEVLSKVPYLVQTGGYIPTCDHAVPPSVPFENYVYYLNLIRDIAGIA